jgi:NDP-sugar pyrophosphorylase family protein
MRAVILAGGQGIRLYPITKVIPKPLVPIGETPILEIVIRQLRNQGIRRITLAVGYMARLIESYFHDGSRLGVEIDYSFEPSSLGTAGPLALIQGLDDTFLVMNADVLTNLNYDDLVAHHKRHGGLLTIAAFQQQVTIDLGVIISDGHSRIKDYVEKPSIPYLVSMGIYVFEPGILEYIPKNARLDFPDLVKLLLRDLQPVNYYSFSGYWLDIGRHEDYAQASEEFNSLQGELGLYSHSPDGVPVEKDGKHFP